MSAYESPMGDWPHVHVEEDGVHITGSYTSPRAAYHMDQLGPGILFLIAGAILYPIGYSSKNLWIAIGGPFAVLIFAKIFWNVGLESFLLGAFPRHLSILVDEKSIRINGKTYSRAVPIELRLETHHKAIKEYAKEVKTGQRQQPVYRNAWEVAMQYGLKRIVIAEMRHEDEDKATALLLQIQLAMQNVDRVAANISSEDDAKRLTKRNPFGPEPRIG